MAMLPTEGINLAWDLSDSAYSFSNFPRGIFTTYNMCKLYMRYEVQYEPDYTALHLAHLE
jgi:hypothetical protein